MTPAPTLRDLLQRDAASRSSGRFCADCVNTGQPCPDHRDDAATSTTNRGNPA